MLTQTKLKKIEAELYDTTQRRLTRNHKVQVRYNLQKVPNL